MKGFNEKAKTMLCEKDSQQINVTFSFQKESGNYSLGFLDSGNRHVFSRNTLGKKIPNNNGELNMCIAIKFSMVNKS